MPKYLPLTLIGVADVNTGLPIEFTNDFEWAELGALEGVDGFVVKNGKLCITYEHLISERNRWPKEFPKLVLIIKALGQINNEEITLYFKYDYDIDKLWEQFVIQQMWETRDKSLCKGNHA